MEINEALKEEASIDEQKNVSKKSSFKTKKALDFGPFITDEGFTLLESPISGAELKGKTQRLIVAVLQGRLADVNIEGNVASVSTLEAVEMFFDKEAFYSRD